MLQQLEEVLLQHLLEILRQDQQLQGEVVLRQHLQEVLHLLQEIQRTHQVEVLHLQEIQRIHQVEVLQQGQVQVLDLLEAQVEVHQVVAREAVVLEVQEARLEVQVLLADVVNNSRK